MFGTAPVTLYRAIRAGEFPAVRIRGRLIVPAKAIEAMASRGGGPDRGRRFGMGAVRGGAAMTGTATSTTVGCVDAALDQVQQCRERILAEAPDAARSTRMAELYEHEAGLWSVLFEHARTRVYWRAALAAEVHARQLARHWRRRATAEAHGLPTSARLGGCVEVGEWAKRWQTDLTGGAW